MLKIPVFEDARVRAFALAERIDQNRTALIEILAKQETFHTARYEVEKSLSALRNLDREEPYFNRGVSYISVYLPVNLPLYSLVIFGFVPKLCCEGLFLRPPIAIQQTVEDLADVLELESLSPGFRVCLDDRKSFQSNYTSRSDVVVFTGRFENALSVIRACKKDALFLYNGAGVNPFVIGQDPGEMDAIVTKAVEARTFNSGQDCAGPNAFVVHRSCFDEFSSCLIRKLSVLKCGAFASPGIDIGPLVVEGTVIEIATKMRKWGNQILYGGSIDLKDGIVMPVVAAAHITERWNYDELFAPVFFLLVYDNESEVAEFCARSEYRDFAMYASVFGEVQYMTEQTHTIVLRNKSVLEFEDGNEPFGGHGARASFARIGGKTHCHPVLVSREISRYLPH